MQSNKKLLSRDDAASVIQLNLRGFFVRKKFMSRDNLPSVERSLEPTFVLGNDPDIKGLEFYKPTQEQPIAILATSGLRILKIACQLGTKNFTPHVFLIDNSDKVYHFWQAIRAHALRHKDGKSFRNQLPELFRAFNKSGITGKETHVVIVTEYLKILFNRYGYDYVRGIINDMTLVCQSWENPSVFIKMRNILNKRGCQTVYVYASNILACLQEVSTQNSVLKNIAYLKPTLTIYTDVNSEGYPQNVFLVTDYSPDIVKKLIISNADKCSNESSEASTNASDQMPETEDESDDEFFASMSEKIHTQNYGWLNNFLPAYPTTQRAEAESGSCQHNPAKRNNTNASSASPISFKCLKKTS